MYGYLARTTVIAHHGIKGMKWGVRRFQNSDGSLTSAGRERYGVSSFKSAYDPNNKSERSKIRAYKKDLKQINRSVNDSSYRLQEEMALNNEQEDLNDANNDKEFISDLKKETEKFWKAAKNGDQDWFDVEEQSIKRLQKKYPKHKDIIAGYAPHEKIYKDSDINEIFNAKDKNVVGRLLNYDFYYDPFDSKYSDAVNKIEKSARSEFSKKLQETYGKDFIDKISSQKPTSKAKEIGKKVVPFAVAAVGPLAVAAVVGGGGYLMSKTGSPSNKQIDKAIKESLKD